MFYPMSTSKRHNNIIGEIFYNIRSQFEDALFENKMITLQEEIALVHWGEKKIGDISLVDVSKINDIKYFTENTINDLEFVQPDYCFFKELPYLCNTRETRFAGTPDFICEVWSDSNYESEKNLKMKLYSSFPKTEHWYINQFENTVVCYLGENRLDNQYLDNILVTQKGIKIDLTKYKIN